MDGPCAAHHCIYPMQLAPRTWENCAGEPRRLPYTGGPCSAPAMPPDVWTSVDGTGWACVQEEVLAGKLQLRPQNDPCGAARRFGLVRPPVARQHHPPATGQHTLIFVHTQRGKRRLSTARRSTQTMQAIMQAIRKAKHPTSAIQPSITPGGAQSRCACWRRSRPGRLRHPWHPTSQRRGSRRPPGRLPSGGCPGWTSRV